MTDFNDIKESLVNLDEPRMLQLVKDALENGNLAGDILNKGLIAAMDIIGEKMEKGDMFIPEVLMSAKTMNTAVEILKPFLSAEDMSSAGHIVIGTVKGDLHDIGKNLVSMMVESAGFKVTDLGVDVSPEAFVKAVQENKADIVALSAL